MSNVTIAGWSVGSVDGVASVREAWEAYLANKNANTLAAYKAAFYNALAAETALIPGAGAYFASAAWDCRADRSSVWPLPARCSSSRKS